MSKTKQVIVIRTRYPDGKGGNKKIRTGKLFAQGFHGAMAFTTSILKRERELNQEEIEWLNNSYTKICCQVKTEEELRNIHQKALENGLTSYLIIDNGLTEFKGIPTATCVCIGPNNSEIIDKITGKLELF